MKKYRYSAISEINVTNLVDVTLVILIIFMITAPLLRRGFDIALPRADAENIPSKNHIVVSLDKTGSLHIDNKTVAPEAFDDALSEMFQAAGKPPVLLQADEGIPYGQVISLMDRIKSIGITRIGLVVEPGKSP